MPSHEENGADFISIVVADSTRIHTQLLADAMRTDHGLQVVASASSSEELLAAVMRVPVDVAVISYSLDDQPGRGTEVLREMRALRPQVTVALYRRLVVLPAEEAQVDWGAFGSIRIGSAAADEKYAPIVSTRVTVTGKLHQLTA